MAQNLSDRIDDFKSWALKLGCPVKALPSDAALNRFMKSKHANVQKTEGQIQSQCEVKSFRDNLLLQNVSASNLVLERSDLPDNLKKLRKAEKLNRQISELRPRVTRQKRDVKEKKSSAMEKADQLKQLKKSHRNIKTKCIQLQQKHEQWTEKVDEEKKFELMLMDGMYVPINASTDEKIAAEKAIKKSMDLLRNFYDEIGDREFTKANRDKAEREIKKMLAGVPVVTLFDAIKCYRNDEMNAVNEKFDSINVHPPNATVESAFEIAATKCRIRIYIDYLTINKLKEEHANRVEQYVDLYDQYLAKIVNDMKVFNGPDVELFAESICSDYLKQYGSSIYNQAMLQFHQQKLSTVQQMAAERDNHLKGKELTTAELTQMYATIETLYNSILDDIVALSDTHKNIKQLQALSKYTINSFGNRSIFNTSTSLLNCTLGSVVPSITLNLAPAEYVTELSMLVDVPYEKWNQLPFPISMDIECLQSNDDLSPFYSLLTPNTILKELKSKWTWYRAIDVLTKPLDVDKTVPRLTDAEVDTTKMDAETAKMINCLEDVRFMYETGNKTVSEIRNYLAFLLDTSLGSFIPDTVMINRRNYRDYEEEFLCACSLISNSMNKI